MDTLDRAKRECNYCKEEIFSDLRRCPYCGSLLEMKEEEYDSSNLKHDAPTSEESEKSVDFVLVENTHVEKINEQQNAKPLSEQHIFEHYKSKNRLSNGMKVFLTIIATIIPGLGQLAGIIISIVLMNNEEDDDRRSFGIALLVASLIFFVISCFSLFIVLLALFSSQG